MTRAHRLGFELAAALAAASFGWAATSSWGGLVVDPARYLTPALIAALLIAVVGTTGRSLGLHWYAVLGIQVVTVLVWFHHRHHSDGFAGGWIPTPGGLADVFDQVRDGASAIDTHAAPVNSTFVDVPVYLTACALLVLLLIDLIGCGLRLPAWAGLPALIAVTIPISVLADGLPAGVYVTTGLLFALLLAIVEADRAASWGPVIAESTGPSAKAPRLPLGTLAAPAAVIGTAATLLALVVSLGIPVGNGLLIRDRQGAGAGAGGPGRITLNNPMADLRRDLVRNDHQPLLDVATRSRDVSYLRLTILDSFRDATWFPSPRDLGATHRADGELPDPPGQSADRTGPESFWQLATSPNFETSWLPTPSMTRWIGIADGDWRYDPRFLDIVNVNDNPPTPVMYELRAASPKINAADLAAAGRAPADLIRTMTALPALPEQVRQIADDVTAGAATDYAKAVRLQDWFRRSGGFTYSLDPDAGSGLDQLVRFITTDRVGYCEQYAAAMAVMARALGIPARVVVGFLSPSDKSPSGFSYTSDDLHAWPEIYFAGSGWVRFEPTPSARTGASPLWTRSNVETPDPAPSPGTPTNTPGQQPSPAPTPDPTTNTVDTAPDTDKVPVPILVAGGIVVLLLLLAIPGLARSGQRRRRFREGPDLRADLESLWRELGATAVDIGAPWPEDRSARMVAAQLDAWVCSTEGVVATDTDRAALEHLVVLVEHARYSGTPTFDIGAHARAAEATRRWIVLIQGTATSRQIWGVRIAPRSVLASRR